MSFQRIFVARTEFDAIIDQYIQELTSQAIYHSRMWKFQSITSVVSMMRWQDVIRILRNPKNLQILDKRPDIG